MITSVSVKKMYDHPNDSRVKIVVEQLLTLSDSNNDMFRLIDEIDFGNKKFLKVSVDGLNYRLKLRAESFSKRYK